MPALSFQASRQKPAPWSHRPRKPACDRTQTNPQGRSPGVDRHSASATTRRAKLKTRCALQSAAAAHSGIAHWREAYRYPCRRRSSEDRKLDRKALWPGQPAIERRSHRRTPAGFLNIAKLPIERSVRGRSDLARARRWCSPWIDASDARPPGRITAPSHWRRPGTARTARNVLESRNSHTQERLQVIALDRFRDREIRLRQQRRSRHNLVFLGHCDV